MVHLDGSGPNSLHGRADMKLYFNVIRRWWTVFVATALLGLVSWSLGGTEIPVPGFMGGMVSMRVEYFAPLLVIVAVLYCLDRRLEAPESTAVVRLRRWDLAAVSSQRSSVMYSASSWAWTYLET